LKRLENILKTVNVLNDVVSGERIINGVAIDSRKVDDNYMFIAYRGHAQDGHQYIDAAIDKGASVILLDDASYIRQSEKLIFVLVDDARESSVRIARSFYEDPGADMNVVAVTGTNGKTTTVKLLYDLFSDLGYSCGLISTISICYGGEEMPAQLTTPDPVSLQAMLHDMKELGITHVFMEASSHALDQGRLKGLKLRLAMFTNISHDHLDYHKTFDNYIEAKKLLFDDLDQDADAVVNIDDPRGIVMVQNSKARVHSYALKRPANFKGRIIVNDIGGLQMKINNHELFLRLIGDFNAYNALAVFAAATCLGEDETDVLIRLSKLKAAEGRLDIIKEEGVEFTAVVDYAHTPDALEKVLECLKAVKKNDSRLIAVLGCGGNRDKTKRPIMAKIAARIADQSIFTSDNPRDEDPEKILDDMTTELESELQKKTVRISDRKQAIKTAVLIAQKSDIILVAGKGHEKYQEIKGQKTPFDDKEILRKMMRGEDI
jgi:UDP-N-acetylmuramoyl-L-alanyl-D-glutamate--2,6-diaminopimelate ligase